MLKTIDKNNSFTPLLKNKDYSLSMIRLISTLLIVSCHFLQFYGNKLAFIFNIGVQFFLIISGLLYGLKSDEITIEKTWKNIKKILLDYLIFIVIAIVLHFLFLDTKYTLRQLLPVFFCMRLLPGLEHLWYIPTILLCYIIAPFLSLYKKKVEETKFKYLWKLLFLFIFIFVVYYNFPGFSIGWISCFVISFLFSKDIKNIRKSILYLGLPLIIISCFLQYLKFFTTINDYFIFSANQIYEYIRILGALSLFMIIYYIFSFINFSPISKILNISDKYSYDLYLCHQIFILGPLSLLTPTPKLSNLFLTILSIVALTFILICIKQIILLLIKKLNNYVLNRKSNLDTNTVD